jgi:hypothetical protein
MAGGAEVSESQILAELREIRAELRVLAALFERKKLRRVEVDPAITRFMQALSRAAPVGVLFTSAEVVAHSRVEGEEELRDSLVAACGAPSSKRVGKLLRRLEGIPFARGSVVRVGSACNVALWSISKPAETHVPLLQLAGDKSAG